LTKLLAPERTGRVMIFISILILIVAIALPSFKKQISSALFTRISSIIFLYAGALSFNAYYIQSIGSGIGIYSGLFHVTIVSQILEVFIYIIGSIILISWPTQSVRASSYANLTGSGSNARSSTYSLDAGASNNYSTEYSLLVLFSTLGASLLISSSDLVSMYLSIELQSFGVYILATLYKNSVPATSAGLKYFLLGGLSSCIILLGAGLIYTFTGLTNFESMYSLISVYDTSVALVQGFNLGIILIIIGLLFKIAAAPLHHWAPDVYDDSPTIVTIWLTIMPKISIIFLLLEIQTGVGLSSVVNLFSANSLASAIEEIDFSFLSLSFPVLALLGGNSTKYVLKYLLLISSLLSLIIGTIVGLAQTRIKRLLAYSTISHIGFMLLALSVNTEESIDALIFYIIQYTITNLNAFLVIIALSYTCVNYQSANRGASGARSSTATTNLPASVANLITTARPRKINLKTNFDIKFISELKSQYELNPLLSLSLTICLFSMAGIPPLIGFFSKQFVLYAAIQNGYYFMSIVAIIVSVISASYYLKLIRVLHTASDSATPETLEEYLTLDQFSARSSASNSANINYSISFLSNIHSFLISSLTLTLIMFVLKPSIILNLTQLLTLSLFNF
jgi:NADH-ubiquinone oxidoreductase chain 2